MSQPTQGLQVSQPEGRTLQTQPSPTFSERTTAALNGLFERLGPESARAAESTGTPAGRSARCSTTRTARPAAACPYTPDAVKVGRSQVGPNGRGSVLTVMVIQVWAHCTPTAM